MCRITNGRETDCWITKNMNRLINRKNTIEILKNGDAVLQGNTIGFLGDASVNGDYAPHLHFQIIKELEDNFGDYPGVSSEENIKFYSRNCPNPNLLLKLSI